VDIILSNSAFKFNLRRYTKELKGIAAGGKSALEARLAARKVGRFTLTLSNPC
jgi:hypothetical protein